MYDLTKKAYNQFKIKGDTCYLTIKNHKGKSVVIEIDAEDAGRVEELGSWAWHTGRSDKAYAMHALNRTKRVQLSRFVMSTPDHLYCKFVDGNSKNCKKSNLVNVQFQDLQESNSGHPYIYWSDRLQHFSTRVYDPAKKRTHSVGEYKSIEIALEKQKAYLQRHPQYRVPGVKP